jgi:hypothetical protein
MLTCVQYLTILCVLSVLEFAIVDCYIGCLENKEDGSNMVLGPVEFQPD